MADAMQCNPCCCMNLATGAKVFAVVDMVVSMIGLLYCAVEIGMRGLSFLGRDGKDLVGIFAIICVIIDFITPLVLAFTLYSGVAQQNHHRIKSWGMGTIVIEVITFLLLVITVAHLLSTGEKLAIDWLIFIILVIFIALYKIYEIVVVFAYGQQINPANGFVVGGNVSAAMGMTVMPVQQSGATFYTAGGTAQPGPIYMATGPVMMSPGVNPNPMMAAPAQVAV